MKVGLIAPFSGYDAGTAYQMLLTIRAVVDRWNGHGGIGGYRVELVALDDQNDPVVAAARVREMAVDRDVVAVMARLNGRGEAAVAEYQRRGLPVVILGSPLASPEAPDAVWRMCADAADEGQQAARFAVGEVQSIRPAVVIDGGAGYRAAASAFAAALGYRPFSVVLPLDEKPLPGQAGTTSDRLAEVVASAGIDFVYFSGPYDIGASFASALAQRSSARVLLGSDADTPALAHLLPLKGAAIAHVSSCQTAAPERPSSATRDSTSNPEAAGPIAALAQEGAQLVLEAASGAASAAPPSRAVVAAAMRASGVRDASGGTAVFDSLGRRRGAGSTIRRPGGM